MPASGDWVVAVWSTAEAPVFAVANYRQLESATCGMSRVKEFVATIPLSQEMIGGGFFNMDRELLGVILPCGDRVAAVEPSSVDQMLARLTTVEERVLTVYGALLGVLSQGERQYFSDADGLLVREVWVGTRAEAAGLQPGDLVVALNGSAVASVDDLQPLVASTNAPFELTVRRGSATSSVELGTSAAAQTSPDEGGLGLVIESPRPIYRVGTVRPDSRAAQAGLRPADVLRRVNHVEPRTRAQAERAIKNGASAPILLEVERDRRRVAILIPGGAAR
jgi:serine protease Do